MRIPHARAISLALAVLMLQMCLHAGAQAALILHDADGAAEVLSPTGHESVYFARICAEGPIHLRRCRPGELGSVISRYRGIDGYDWLAMPVLPYLYSVENAAQVPTHINRETVQSLRLAWHDTHLMRLGNAQEGSAVHPGWNQLVGTAYERRIWLFRFTTSEEQDNALIRKMNDSANRSRFNIFFNNCSNFTSSVLDFYFPHTFKRHLLPDLGIVTPREVAYELVRYARKHPELELSFMEIPLLPGIHHSSRVGKSADESLIASGDVIPIAIFCPYAAGAILVDALIWGREPLPLKNARVLSPREIAALQLPSNGTIAQESPELGNGSTSVTLLQPSPSR
jgi:hypothetical protein